jgi:Fe-S cluster assembly ATP-binding protein
MLELKNLTFSAQSTEANGKSRLRTIINNINYTFEKGKFYAITGPNGSGKTTLAKLIMGINEATSGSVIFDGKDVTKLSITERARAGIAYSFQNPARFKGTTCRDLLAMAAKTDDEKVITDIITRVGICSLDFLDKPVDGKLSGGEIKKIELATTIALNPKVAIYDEPDTGIDLWTIDPMVNLIKKEQRDHGTTTLVVSHNRVFLEAADVLLIVKDGTIIYTGNLKGAMPLLNDFSFCSFTNVCEGELNARCYR